MSAREIVARAHLGQARQREQLDQATAAGLEQRAGADGAAAVRGERALQRREVVRRVHVQPERLDVRDLRLAPAARARPA